jgi:hypothetical protein
MLLTQEESSLLFDKLFPLGKVPQYDHKNQTITLSDTSTRRFIFDSQFVKRLPRTQLLSDPEKYNTTYLGFGLLEALSVLVQDNYSLYKRLYDLFTNIDKEISKIIPQCGQAAVLFSHKSFADKLITHIHQDDENNLPTLSIFFRLTDIDNELPVLTLFDELDHDSKILQRGYTDHRLMLIHERKSTHQDNISIQETQGVFFNASKTPHCFSYTNDIWVTVVYDHVAPSIPIDFTKNRYYVCPIKF